REALRGAARRAGPGCPVPGRHARPASTEAARCGRPRFRRVRPRLAGGGVAHSRVRAAVRDRFANRLGVGRDVGLQRHRAREPSRRVDRADRQPGERSRPHAAVRPERAEVRAQRRARARAGAALLRACTRRRRGRRSGGAQAARRAGAAAIAVAAACAVFAALVVPAARSVALVHRGESDAGIGARGDPKQVQRVENYVHRRAAGVRYEVIIPSYSRAAPYIAAYPRPVLVLTTVKKRPAVRVPELAALARAHQVKFALLDGRCARARPTHLAGCPKTSIWIRRHSIDISRRAGFPSPGVLFELTKGRRPAPRLRWRDRGPGFSNAAAASRPAGRALTATP